MPAPTVDPLPPAPSRLDSPATFTTDADAFVAALVDLPTQINAVATFLSALESGTLSLLLAAIDSAGSGTNKLPYYTGSNTVALADLTAAARSVLDDATVGDMLTTLGLSANGKSLVTAADYSAMRTLLGLVIGTNVQAFSSVLSTYAGITPSANVQTMLAAANNAAIRAAIGAGTGTGDLVASNNLSELTASAATARTNIGAAARSPSIQTVTSSATVTPTFADDQVNITAQAAALDLANPTGTAVPAWGLVIRIKDNGTARAITYNSGSGSQYRAIGVTLPTTTVISKTLYLGMIYNSTDTKWDVVAVAQEA